MKQFSLSLILMIFSALGLNAQLNMDSIGHIDLNTMHNQDLNDIWGYVDEFGNEYALVGGTKGVSVVDITTPSNPTEIFFEPGLESIWRDIKTWGDYAYITTEEPAGLTIIDLSPLPGSTAFTTTTYNGPTGNQWNTAHNLYIDSAGYCYIFGSDRDNGGVIILNLNPDPMNPVEVGVFDNWYVHDGYVDNDTMYCGNIYEGFFSVVDVTDRANPVLLGTANSPSFFTHNIWTSNNQYAFTTDELSGGYIGAYDVSDPANIFELDRIQSSPGAGVIPHNVHVKQNHIISSYYSDGVIVHDVTYPYNMIEVANYDTYPAQTANYNGCWGVFPFFPSGIIVASDITEGMFVLNPTYVQAAYLEGTVTDASTLQPINGAQIDIAGSVQSEITNTSGFYATGMVNGGMYNVTYSKVGYYPQTVPVSITNGVITTNNIQLTPIPQYSFDVNVFDNVTGNPIDAAKVRLEATLITHEGQTNALGVENFSLYYEEPYYVTIGKWGYFTYCDTVQIDNTTGSITVYLDPGYYDDYSFDFGWMVSGTAVTGMFERGEPNGTSSGSNPDQESGSDCGVYCYVTGNAETLNADFDDVDGGNTQLQSPLMDLTTYSDPYLNYERFFYNNYGPLPPWDDTLKVFISNGTQTVLVDTVGSDPAIFFQWIPKSIRILDYISLSSAMRVTFFTSDEDPGINITEAAIDHFFISEQDQSGLAELENGIKIYPNPVLDYLKIETDHESDFVITSMSGQLVMEGVLDVGLNEFELRDLEEGIYLIYINGEVFRIMKTK